MKTFRIIVKGRVQGVQLRNLTKKFCDENEIFGSVMNLEDGSVLIIAQAKKESLDVLLKWLKTSPGFSKVREVDFSEIRMNERFYEFNIIRESNFFKDQGRAFGNLGKGFFRNGKT